MLFNNQKVCREVYTKVKLALGCGVAQLVERKTGDRFYFGRRLGGQMTTIRFSAEVAGSSPATTPPKLTNGEIHERKTTLQITPFRAP